MTLVLIRAVPWDVRRSRRARELAQRAAGLIIWDEIHDGYDTWMNALNYAAMLNRAAIHLEDDVRLTNGWQAKAEAVIAARPHQVIQFFSNRAADVRDGSRDEPGRSFLMTQCFYVPARLAGPLAAYAPRWPGRRGLHPTEYDRGLADFLDRRGESYHLHVPSLVQHERWPSAISAKRTAVRQSRTFRP